MISVKVRLLLFGVSFAFAIVRLSGAENESTGDFFEKNVRPVFIENCYQCHGPEKQKSGLRLDSLQNLLQGGDSGQPALVPGHPESSRILAAIRHVGKLSMPKDKPALSEEAIASIEHWISLGAPWPAESAPIIASGDEAKKHWAYQPVINPKLPSVVSEKWINTPIDRFVLSGLEKAGLAPAAKADRRQLIRRATFDLTGLPPSPQEIEAFVSDSSNDAYAKVIDRLLDSPRYGVRWARHWLDLARYADTSGDSADFPVPQAGLYRDYVVDAFNRNKPYDQFVREQLAGDLLPAKNQKESAEHIIATGYLALAKRFGNGAESPHLVIEDVIDTTSRSLLGLTVACARCHNHKFDPISNRDYYALYGIFSSTRYPYAGSELLPGTRDLVSLVPLQPGEAETAAFISQLDKQRKELGKQRWDARKLEGVDRERAVAALNVQLDALRDQTEALFVKMPSRQHSAYAVAEGRGHNARIQLRGEPDKLGDEVPRKFLGVLGGADLTPAGETGSGRLELANAIVDPKNPLTARVMVNRIWQHHFGSGLVKTPSDFGSRGIAPSNPALLDYLATSFMDSGWSIKAMHRLIMLSQSYQMSCDVSEEAQQLDPNNDLVSRFRRQRLDAEQIRDSLLLLAGQLDESPAPPHPFPPERQWNFSQHDNFVADYPSNRRSLYLMQQRLRKLPLLAVFDSAETTVTTAERDVTTTPLQALFFMNDDFVYRSAENFSHALQNSAPTDYERIARAYELAFGRPADAAEISAAKTFLANYAKKTATLDLTSSAAEAAAWNAFVHVLLTANEFIYVD